jgi:enamine deaminase RidA (YjgF/YER057c/UK114 family)
MERVHIRTQQTPANMSQGVRAGDLVIVSGQLAFDDNGALVGEGDIARQAEQCFRNIGSVLATVGGALDDVVKLTSFLVDPADAAGYLETRAVVFPRDPPASTTVVVAALLVPGALIEIEALAVLRPRESA